MKQIFLIFILFAIVLFWGSFSIEKKSLILSNTFTPTGTTTSTTTTTIPSIKDYQNNKSSSFTGVSRLKVSNLMTQINPELESNPVIDRDPSAQINDLEFNYEILIRTIGEKRHNVELYTSAFYSRLDVYDVTNDSKASALSEVNNAIGVKYKYQISYHWGLEGNGEIQQNKMSQSVSNRRLNNTTLNTNKINFAINYKPSDHFIGYLRVIKNDFLFLEPSGLDFNLSSKSLTGYGIGVNSLLPLDQFILTSSFGLDQFVSNYDGSIKVLSGHSIYGKIGAQFNLFGLPLFTEGFYRHSQFGIHYPSSTTTFEQKNQEIGLNLGIVVNF